MKTHTFMNWRQQASKLTGEQRHLIEQDLNLFKHPILDALNQKTHSCPHCKSSRIIRFGQVNGRQRFRCKACTKTHMSTFGTAFFKMHHPQKWHDYLLLMPQGTVLRHCAKKLNISLTTSFNWRHRFLKVIDSLMDSHLEGIVEADETYTRYSEKGSRHLTHKARKRGEPASTRGLNKQDWVPILVAIDRSHHEVDSCLNEVNGQAIEDFLESKIARDATLCTDGHRAYLPLCQHQELNHKVLSNQRVLEHSFHIQTVNSYHNAIKLWIRHFHGVASKYLSHYLAWLRLKKSDHFNLINEIVNQQHVFKT